MFDSFNSVAFQVHGGGHNGIAAVVGDLLAFVESLLSMQPAEIFSILMPGMAVMQNHHPMVVHFPIAFLLAFFVLDVIASIARKEAWRNVAGWLLYLGSVSAIVAVAFGLNAAATVPHGENVHGIMERHEHLGLTVLVLSILLSLWRWLGKSLLRGAANVLYLGVSAIMVVCLTLGADLGGLMVYHYGINVGLKPIPPGLTFEDSSEHPPDHSHTHEHSH